VNAYIWQHRLVDYTYAELVAVQRASRSQRRVLFLELSALEERILRGGLDGEMMNLQKIHGGLDSEIRTLDEVIRKQWSAIINRGQPP
jgi:hypothetical protein